MKNHLKKLENKKILQEYTYIKTDLILKKSILEESQSEFMKIVYDKIGNKRKKLEEDINNELKQEKEKKDFPDNLKKKAKNLYREISKKTHPDKDTFGVYTNIFSESAIAYEDCDLLTLYSICDQLHIEYEIDECEIDGLKTTIDSNKEMIKKIESSFIYLWSTNQNEKIKDVLINKFIRTIKGDSE